MIALYSILALLAVLLLVLLGKTLPLQKKRAN